MTTNIISTPHGYHLTRETHVIEHITLVGIESSREQVEAIASDMESTQNNIDTLNNALMYAVVETENY